MSVRDTAQASGTATTVASEGEARHPQRVDHGLDVAGAAEGRDIVREGEVAGRSRPETVDDQAENGLTIRNSSSATSTIQRTDHRIERAFGRQVSHAPERGALCALMPTTSEVPEVALTNGPTFKSALSASDAEGVPPLLDDFRDALDDLVHARRDQLHLGEPEARRRRGTSVRSGLPYRP